MTTTSTVLTGLSLATGIAREATDAVPIVKQVLGVASRIVALAEQIEKNREDLHALVERARTMDATLAAVVGDRELNGVVLRRLEAVNAALRDIESWFSSHIKRGRVRKSLGYIFTVRKEVERLKGQFDDRLKELEMAANMDTNIVARGDSRFIGEFRNIRHCEINLLRHLPYLTQSGERYTINYHSATCEGSNEVFVVRYTVECELNDGERRRVEVNERILERMSLIQNRHPVIACLYGKNHGPKDNRFIVLKVGDIQRLVDVLGERSADLALFGRIAAQLVDAACHLQKRGIVWVSLGQPIYVDSHYQPRIGMHDYEMDCMSCPTNSTASLAASAVAYLFESYSASVHTAENHIPSEERRSTKWTMQLFGHLIDAGYRTLCQENSIRLAEIASRVLFSKESWMYLQHADDTTFHRAPSWGAMLAALVIGSKKREGHILHAVYWVFKSEESDLLQVWSVDDDVDTVYHTETHFEIPHSASNEVMQRLGIDVIADEQDRRYRIFYLQRIAGPGATLPTCTGWTQGVARWSPWWCPVRLYTPESHRDQVDWDDPTYLQRAEIRAGEDGDLCDTIAGSDSHETALNFS